MSQEITPAGAAPKGAEGAQETKEKSVPYKVILPLMPGAASFLWRYRSHPETLEPYIASLQKKGIPEKNLAETKQALIAWFKAAKDKQASHRIDRYLVGGIGAVDLVLFSVLLAVGASDRPLFIALIALAISLPLSSCSLFISYIKSEYKIAVYGAIHSNLMFFSLLSGAIALAAAFWHLSTVAGILFSCLTGVLFLVSLFYFLIVLVGTYYFQIQQAAIASNAQAISQNTDGTAKPLPDETSMEEETKKAPGARKASHRRTHPPDNPV